LQYLSDTGIGATLKFIAVRKQQTKVKAEKFRKASAAPPVTPNRRSTGFAGIPMNG